VTRRRRGLLAAAALGTAAAAVALPWLVDAYTTALAGRTLVLALVAASVALLTGVAGLPTLGQTAPFAAGAYTSGYLATHGQTTGVVLVLAAAGAGAAFAAVTVPLVVYARGVVFLMITLAIGELAVTAAGRWRTVTGGTDGLFGLPAARPAWGTPELLGDRARYLYVLAVTAAVLGALGAVLRTPAGLLLRSARDDERRMRASGHRVTAYLSTVYIAAGTVAGVAGALLVISQQYVSPADFGFDVAALLLLGVVIGGVVTGGGIAGGTAATIAGAVAGTAAVIATRDWVSGHLPGQGPLLLGALFTATALLAGKRHGRALARGRSG
jgi:branched-chain amino acid transport system permease protein